MWRTDGREAGFTLVEMLVVLGLLGILSLMATVTMANSSGKAYKAAMQSDLRNLVAAQEAYVEQTFAETGTATYASDIQNLKVNLSNGVQVRLRGNANGWSASTTHSRVSGSRCAVYRGNVRPFAPATQEGVIACD